MCAILISKVLRLECINAGSHSLPATHMLIYMWNEPSSSFLECTTRSA